MGLLGHLLVPGYPQARNGDRGRALLMGGAVLACLLLAALTAWLRSPVGLLSFLAVVVALAAWSHVDGRRRRGRAAPVPLQPLEWALLALPPWLFVTVALIPPARDKILGIVAYRTPPGHESMAPTLLGGDRFVVDLRAREPGRGDLVVFASPEEPLALVKRVVALEGDVVQASAEGIEVNGQLAVAGDAGPFGPVTVPLGSVFAVGDNLPRSRDSRHFGAVRKSTVRGGVLYVFWSRTWSRIGTTPR